MNCKNCYQEIPDGSKFCPHCGAKQNEVQPNAEQENAVKNDPVQATGQQRQLKMQRVTRMQQVIRNNSGYQECSRLSEQQRLSGCIRLSEQRRLSGCSRLSE